MNVTRSIIINAPKENVHKAISDFHTWSTWSPWLITEPTAIVDVDTDGKHYTWSGNRVGAGEMTITSETEDRIDSDLLFLKPYKSKAKIHFLLKSSGQETEVSWNMDSKLPFFLFFMKKKMEAFIGNDYDRGLRMLKEYVEDGKVQSHLDFIGTQPFEGTKYVGIRRETTFEGMKQHMGKDFESLMSTMKTGNGYWYSIYHKFDMVKNIVHYTACVGVDDLPMDMPENWVSGEIPKCDFHIVRHEGPYDHIGNAWSAIMMQIRGKEFKPKKGSHPMEFYRNSPQDTPAAELVSDICFILK